MVNHIRTLLLNRSSDRLNPGCDWAQYVDPEFSPTGLPQYLLTPWKTIFGDDPDPWRLNWQGAKLTNLLHLSELSPYMTAFDSRISYQVPTRIEDLELPVTTVYAANGNAEDLVLSGAPGANSALGRMKYDFRLSRTGASSAVLRDLYRLRDTQVDLRFSGGRSQLIPLGGSGTSAVVQDSAIDDSWDVSIVATPQQDLTEVVSSLESLPAEYLSQVFYGRTWEPVKSFYNLWTDSRGFALKLGAFLLAWAWRLEVLRNA